MIYSSKTTGLFHDADLGGEMPADAIEISPELHTDLLRGQSGLMMINFETEPPSLVERPPTSAEQLAEVERHWRDGQLSKTDGMVARHRDELESGVSTTLKADQYTEMQRYRHQLRDWPQGDDFPLAEHRPITPAWLVEQMR
ncbi:phage tail protein [Pseudomonas fluorescens]